MQQEKEDEKNVNTGVKIGRNARKTKSAKKTGTQLRMQTNTRIRSISSDHIILFTNKMNTCIYIAGHCVDGK